MNDHKAEVHEVVSSSSKRWEEPEGPDPRAHSAELDALRGIAILKVFVGHVAGQWWALTGIPLTIPLLGWDALDALRLSPGGVFLFFILSGYLLTWTEERRIERGTYSLKSYALRRVLRILPAYYVAILLVVVLWPAPASVADVMAHATFLHTLSPYTTNTLDPVFWSLASEVLFYCMLPFVVLKLPRLWQRLVLFAVLLFVSQASQIYGMETGLEWLTRPEGLPLEVYLNHLPTTHLYLFVAGMLLRTLTKALGNRSTSRLRSVAYSAVFVVSASYLLTFPYFGLEIASLLLIPPGLLVDLALFAFFASALLGGSWLRRMLAWRPLVFVGVISYSLFLLHQTVLVRVSIYLTNNLKVLDDLKGWVADGGNAVAWAAFSAYFVGVLGLSCAVSYLGYRYVEYTFLRYKPK